MPARQNPGKLQPSKNQAKSCRKNEGRPDGSQLVRDEKRLSGGETAHLLTLLDDRRRTVTLAGRLARPAPTDCSATAQVSSAQRVEKSCL